tara:strand:+ start:92507 stop:93109 length:603 start_codon:yes stop_codon:yes gene_type:complete
MSLGLTLAIAACLSADAPTKNETLLRDDFKSADHQDRAASRGDWKVSGGVISVTQDPVLYEKYANHGPLLAYEIPHDDAEARVQFKPQGCKTVVFTMDAETGHAFRIILRTDRLGSIYGYDPQPGADRPKANPLSREMPMLKDNEWTSLSARVTGQTATVIVNGKEFKVTHPSIDQNKTTVKIGFAFGSFAVRSFELDAI